MQLFTLSRHLFMNRVASISKMIWVGFVILGCETRPFQLSPTDKLATSRNDDNIIFRTGSIHKYFIQYFDSLKNEKIILLDDMHFGDSDSYPIANQGDTIATANGISYLEIRVEDSRADNVTNDYQTTIEYVFYNFHSKPLLFTSRTGVVDNTRNIWLHPPRIGPLKILNLSAYPFVKFPIIVGDTWGYNMTIGKNWSHKDFGGLWKTDTDIFRHHYKVVGESSLVINGQSLSCFQISSVTKSKIGQSSSLFYFSEKHGFLRMSFFSLNGSEIRLTKSL